MEYSPSQKQFYIRNPDQPTTFECDKNLPPLPVPSLKATLDKYLKSVEPFLTEEELAKTRQICKKFQEPNGEGEKLQSLLLERQKALDNWLDGWWLQYAYLKFRGPLIPYLNSAGPFVPNNPGGKWGIPSEKESVERLTLFIFFLLQFRKVLQNGDLKPDIDKRGKQYCMNQFRYLFGTARIPLLNEDKLSFSQQRHITVLRNGHAFSFDPYDMEGETKSAKSIEAILTKIKDKADSMPEGPGIGALTFDHRDKWAVNRESLLKLGNEKTLEVIESSAFVVSLDSSSPNPPSEVCWALMTGDPANRWADKSLSIIGFDNGFGGVNFEHSPMDGMVNVVMSHFIDLGLNDVYNGIHVLLDKSREQNLDFQQLTWNLDASIIQRIKEARKFGTNLSKQLIIKRKCFSHFGKNALVAAKVNPDTFVQACIQLTYMRLHKKPAPTYETATTRQFMKGRTETLRSCTPELVHFCKLMDDPGCTAQRKRQALLTALQTHYKLMSEARNGQGCDRHLMGLKLIALENGLPIPELFSDKAFDASGGNGNFILSTSTTGFNGMSGGTSAMCPEGYGCYYSFDSNKIWFWVTVYASSYETSAEKFSTCQDKALDDVFNLLNYNLTSGKPKL